MLRAFAAIANGGKLLTPTLTKDETPKYVDLNLNQGYLQVVKDGMRLAVNKDGGTVRGLDLNYVSIAGKSGTAEIGVDKSHVNSWVAGFWPQQKPRYAFVLLMEWAPASNSLGASWVMREVFDWMKENRPEYVPTTESVP